MGERVTLNTLDKGQALILQRLDHIEEDVDSKHKQNRATLHIHANLLQKIGDDVWKLKLKIAGYAALGGMLSSVASHLIEKLLNHK